MKNAFTNALSTPVPQGEPVDPRQKANSAGGYTFTVTDQNRLERFLILGTEGGTYYVSEPKLTKDSFRFLDAVIASDEDMVRNTIREVSTNGRAYKNSPAIFALAKLLVQGKNKQATIAVGPDVVRTSTHLFEFASYIELLGGWGRAKREFIAHWYQTKDLSTLAYQVVKYRQRDGWTHRDLWRLAHPRGLNTTLGNWVLGKVGTVVDDFVELDLLRAFEVAQGLTTVPDLMSFMDQTYARNLPWEAYPTSFHKSLEFWQKLFYNGQLRGQALVRNVTRLARIKAFDDMVFARDYADRLTDEQMITKTRLHPINYLNAAVIHENGQKDRKSSDIWSTRRNKDWTTSAIIMDALNSGFYSAFKTLEPAGRRTLIGVDVSGSMAGSAANGLDLTAAQVSAAMSMFTARTEPFYSIMGFAHTFRDLGISASDNLNSAMKKVSNQNFGSTDCSLPMVWAMQNRLAVDTFLVITDNETWAGRVHPHIALRDYRQKMGIDAKLIVAGVSATEFTIADPSDRGMLDLCGFDSNAPKVIADFSTGRV